MSGPDERMRAAGEISIRHARSEDLPAILEIWGRGRSLAASTPDDEAALAALLDRDRDALLVADDGNAIVATLIATWDGWRGNMYRLTVAPEHRRKGIALELVRAGEKRLRAMGARRVSALVWREDGRAVRGWLSAGYEHDEGTGRFVRTLTE